ncbi:MAG TPA: hypothetical protein VNJ04_17985 [Gemmatimonadaceae bacterium]|nr:hypothetical protein [Gemmatimonadaceae bacterium]
MRAGSGLLKLVTLVSVAASVLVVSEMLAGGAVYASLIPPGRIGVPSAVDSLAPARILNGLGGPATYYAMGRDHRHQVITPYRAAVPADLQRFRVDYVLLQSGQVDEFTSSARLSLVARSQDRGGLATSLWKVHHR